MRRAGTHGAKDGELRIMSEKDGGRVLTAGDYLALKAAVRRLVRHAGGQESAAAITRVDHQRISKYGNAAQPMHAPIDVIADLERDVGHPFVTEALAHLQGHVLVKRPSGEVDTEAVTRMLADIGRESGDSIRVLAEAIADHVVTPEEAREIRKEVSELCTVASGIITAMNKIIGTGQP